ncbi:hypothetical protein [Flavisericum labens]|uniref:hypothetical protein n=1 Tax=Flavisericum labens TaxID=3377112 RepID=UPI00387ABB76
MKPILLFILCFSVISCGKEKVIQLPEIEHSEITEINDVSAAYLFYDETQPDSVELNRKNLISTTNWLVNIDKRLTLKQVIPHIQFLQEKKKNSSHKNKNAKNYFTCNDISLKNLGFIEFTDVVYRNEIASNYFSKTSNIPQKQMFGVVIHSINDIEITDYNQKLITKTSNLTHLLPDLNTIFINKQKEFEIFLNFNQNLAFQDYIAIKSKLSESELQNVSIAKDEFIYN